MAIEPRVFPRSGAFDGTGVATDDLLAMRHLVEGGEAGTGSRTMMLPGGIVTRRRGRGLETDDIRPYAFGDDVRHIDRNTTARTGKLHVRTFRDERERSVLLVADFRPSMLFGTRRAFRSVAAAEMLALAGWRIAGQGGRVGVFAAAAGATFFHRPGSGDRAMKSVAGRLSAAHLAAMQAKPGEDPPLASILESAMRMLPHNGTMLVATALDHPGDAFDLVMRDLVHRAALDVLLVVDRFELAPPPGIYPYLAADGRRAAGEVGSGVGASTEIAARMKRIEQLGGRAIAVDASLEPADLAFLVEGFDARRR